MKKKLNFSSFAKLKSTIIIIIGQRDSEAREIDRAEEMKGGDKES